MVGRGKARTSVAMSNPRNSRLSVWMSRSLTSAMLTRAARARAGADAPQPRREAWRARTLRRPRRVDSARRVAAASRHGIARSPAREGFVRFDDLLHELVAHDVALVEMHERDALDVADDPHRLDQAGRAAGRQIDLRDVARDDRLGAEAEARQEHLHLLGRRVLRLVEDHERVVQRAAAHERDRRDLDRAALDVARHALDVEHVVQRVVERPQVRIDLLLQIAGQEPQLLARFDRRPRQDDAVDLLRHEERDRLRHRQVRLAGAGRADAEHDVVLLDRVEIVPLVDASSARRASCRPA